MDTTQQTKSFEASPTQANNESDHTRKNSPASTKTRTNTKAQRITSCPRKKESLPRGNSVSQTLLICLRLEMLTVVGTLANVTKCAKGRIHLVVGATDHTRSTEGPICGPQEVELCSDQRLRWPTGTRTSQAVIKVFFRSNFQCKSVCMKRPIISIENSHENSQCGTLTTSWLGKNSNFGHIWL